MVGSDFMINCEDVYMKRLLTFALAMALLMSAAGCSFRSPEVSESTTAADDGGNTPAVEQSSEAELTPIYDNTAVVSAYKSGDPSKLSEFDREIYDAAVTGISAFYRDGMSDLEIILAAHDYITTLCTYDVEELALIPKRSENSESPYGALINKRAICMGYTTAFQMFMDMLGVESIIVRGEALDEEHAWNMVHVGDDWYHVDCTWDDYVPDYEGRPAVHMFYMMTDGATGVDHIWDRESAPKAESEDLNYYRVNNLFAENSDEIAAILAAAVQKGLTEAEFAVPKDYNTVGMYMPQLERGAVHTYWPIEFDTYNVILAHIDYYE